MLLLELVAQLSTNISVLRTTRRRATIPSWRRIAEIGPQMLEEP
jgi:hypothetical protein